jgi:putative FmdB family regulatory protein
VPLHEYQCQKCGFRFEKIQKFSDPAVNKCPECGGKVQQLLFAPAVQFKGTGWYATDYARKPAPAGNGSKPKPEKTAQTTKAESKSESKDKK